MKTTINSNGSRWYGEKPDSIDKLIEVLGHETLDRTFERVGNFVCRHKGQTRFFGNFRTVSHVFNIDSDDPKVIERLTKAIRANQRTAAYRAQPKPKRR